ncbi:MAG: hypothetical protein FWD93_05460 [Coriobacteriia bacterium]|nr:hypothetical protein [Coriobacteriia bacterium]
MCFRARVARPIPAPRPVVVPNPLPGGGGGGSGGNTSTPGGGNSNTADRTGTARDKDTSKRSSDVPPQSTGTRQPPESFVRIVRGSTVVQMLEVAPDLDLGMAGGALLGGSAEFAAGQIPYVGSIAQVAGSLYSFVRLQEQIRINGNRFSVQVTISRDSNQVMRWAISATAVPISNFTGVIRSSVPVRIVRQESASASHRGNWPSQGTVANSTIRANGGSVGSGGTLNSSTRSVRFSFQLSPNGSSQIIIIGPGQIPRSGNVIMDVPRAVRPTQ